jgi:hypothetical protein
VRVSSPIGDLPFEVTGVRIEGRELVVEGLLGTWRSRIHVGLGDAPMLARAMRAPLATAAVGALAVHLVRRRR